MMAIASNAQIVAENSVKVLTSVNAVAKRAQALDQIANSLNGIVNNLDTTIMFASAGTLNTEDGTEVFAGNLLLFQVNIWSYFLLKIIEKTS